MLLLPKILNLKRMIWNPKSNDQPENPDPAPEIKEDEPSLPLVAVKKAFDWIEKEDLLREEGAVYGLAGCGLAEKQMVIKQYYQQQIDGLKVEEEAINSLIVTAQTSINKTQQVLLDIEERHQLSLQYELKDHHFYRTLFGLLVYGAILAFAFAGTYQWVAPRWERYPELVTLAVFLFGSLSLLENLSMVYQEDQLVHEKVKRENWKIYVEEYVIPVVCAVFVFTCGTAHQPLALNIAFSIFLFAVFLFVGKGLLMSILIIARQRKSVVYNRNQKRKLLEATVALEERTEEEVERLKHLEGLLAERHVALKKVRQVIAKIEQTAAAKSSYFASEFELARQVNKGGAFIRYLQNTKE